MAPYCKKSVDFILRDPKDDRLINILVGAVRSSKTWTMMEKLILWLIVYDVPGDRVIFGVSKDTIYNNVLNELFDTIGSRNYNYNRQTGELYLYDSRWRVVGAKDEGSEKYIRGSTVGVAYGDELTLIPKSFFTMLLTRLSPEGARLYGTTNADSPYHYLWEDYLNNAEMIKSGLVWHENFNLYDNLSLSEAKRNQFLSMYKGVFKKRYIDAEWVAAEGAIYKDSFTDDLLYDDSTRPDGLLNGFAECFIPIDYGTGNPTVFLRIYDYQNMYWVDDEYYWDSNETTVQKTDGQYVNDLEDFLKIAPGQAIVDPSAASLKAEMTLRGIWHCNAKNEVVDGIRTVSNMFAKKLVRINRRCVKFIAEHSSYAWDVKAQQKHGEDKPLKQHDHSCDAFRYFAETKVPKYRLGAI